MTLRDLCLWLAGIGLIAFFAGLIHESMPFPVDTVIGIGVYLLPISVAVALSTRLGAWVFLVAATMLLAALVSGVLGEYLSYRWELWGLSYSDYGSDDMPGVTSLGLRLVLSLFFAIVLGVVVSLTAPLIWRGHRWLAGAVRRQGPSPR